MCGDKGRYEEIIFMKVSTIGEEIKRIIDDETASESYKVVVILSKLLAVVQRLRAEGVTENMGSIEMRAAYILEVAESAVASV